MRLRPATETDRPFCFQLHEASLREYVEPMYGWDDEQQRSFHEAWFRADRLSIIEADDGTAIGVLDVTDEGTICTSRGSRSCGKRRAVASALP